MDISNFLSTESNNFEILIAIFLAAISGLSFRISLGLIGQKWINTFHHTMSYILLPIIIILVFTLLLLAIKKRKYE